MLELFIEKLFHTQTAGELAGSVMHIPSTVDWQEVHTKTAKDAYG